MSSHRIHLGGTSLATRLNPSKSSSLSCRTMTREYSSCKRMLMNKSENSKSPKIYRPGGTMDGVWYTSKGVRSTSLDMGRYGLKRFNYATLEPPVWTVPPHPPTKSIAEKVLFPATIAFTASIIVWAYMNPEEEDMKEYWKRVESGQILVDDDDDDEDDWDEEEEE